MPQPLAIIKQKKPDEMPSVTEGKISPKLLHVFEHRLKGYFLLKRVPEEDWVPSALMCWQEPLVQDWISAEYDKLTKMALEELMLAFRKRWLDDDWELEARREMLALKQADDDSANGREFRTFEDLQNALRSRNIVLTNTMSHFSDAELRTLLNGKMHEDTAAMCAQRKVHLVDAFDDWIKDVVAVDKERLMSLALVEKQLRKRAELRSRLTGSSTFNSKAAASSQNAPAASTSARRNASAAAARSSAQNEDRPPRLTEKDRELLFEHKGCFTCRKFYAGHTARDCKDWPKGSTYVPLTSEMALAAKKNASKVVAAVTVEDVREDDDDEEAPLVASVGLGPSCVLDDSSFGSNDSSN